MVSDLGCSTRNTSVNFDPSNLENFQAPSVDPLPRSDMNLCELSQTRIRNFRRSGLPTGMDSDESGEELRSRQASGAVAIEERLADLLIPRLVPVVDAGDGAAPYELCEKSITS